MSAPLSKSQKRYLSQLSAKAFARQVTLARGQGQVFAGGKYDGLAQTAAEGKYRHDQVVLACGKLGLRCCSQDDYKLVEGHFLELLGHHAAAFNAQLRAATETRRVIEHKIVEACAEFGFHLSYANKICVVQNRGLGLDAVEENRLWQIFYTIRTRGLAKRRKQISEPAYA